MRLQAIFLLFGVLCVGCAHAPPPAPGADGKAAPPFSLEGQNAQIELDFNSHPAITVAYDLAEDEFCYLPIADGVLVCSQGGSYLLFGPEDGVVIVKDNPAYQLRVVKDNQPDLLFMQKFNTLFLLAASVDRLPDALADYLENPGPHRPQAIELARKLLADNGGHIAGAQRGGTFVIHLRLNMDARQNLLDLLQADDNPRGIYRVGNNLPERGDFPFIKRRSSAGMPPRS